MHGAEHGVEKRRTIWPPCSTTTVFAGCRFDARRRAACRFSTGPSTRAGVSLARSGFRFREFRSGVTDPRLTLRWSHAPANFTRSALRLRDPPPVRPSGGRHPRLRPVALLPVRSSGRAASLHSPSGVFAPSGSKRSPGYPAFRSASRKRPIFVRSPMLSIAGKPRIIVPDSLRFRRLAVPETSWNLPQYALYHGFRSTNFSCDLARFHNFFTARF